MVNDTAPARETLTDHTGDQGPMTDQRPDDRSVENEELRKPAHEGEPPRPATEPKGSKGSSNSGETETDPATGEEN